MVWSITKKEVHFSGRFILRMQLRPVNEPWFQRAKLLGGNVFQCRGNSCSNRLGAAYAPEMHEEQARLLCEHVAVQASDRNMIRLEFRDDGIELFRGQHEVARCRHVARVRGLKI